MPPLKGIKVLELGSTVAAPFCGRLLADFGADVIKVEPLQGDAVRSMGRRKNGRSLYAASILRNKRLLALDLNRAEGREIVRRLVVKCDIVIENFRPGRLEKWGLGYEVLSQAHPGLILVRISGYGQNGPYRERLGYGATCEAVSGLRELTGDPDRPPARVNVSLTDEVAALYAAFGAMMALHERESSGRGQVVDTALYEAAFSLIEPHVPAYSALGEVPTRAGPLLPGSAPNNLYPSADGGWVQITAISPSTFAALARLMQRDDLLNDPRFDTAVARAENHESLDQIIADWTRDQNLVPLEHALIEAGIPAARIYRMDDIFADPHFRARDMLVEVQDHDLGALTLPGIVPKLSRTPGAINHSGGNPGADSSHVLACELNMDNDEIQSLADAGVIGSILTQD